MNGMDQVAGGIRDLLAAIRDEGAGVKVSAAAAQMERVLGLETQEDLNQPIVRVAFYSYGHSGAQLSALSVEDLMDENAGFEDSAWYWIEALLRTGTHDDSDLRSGVLVIYMSAEHEQLREQARAWAAANPTVVAAKDLDLSLLEQPTR